jgi:D-sedoheptulose 7-phosphate isomerase
MNLVDSIRRKSRQSAETTQTFVDEHAERIVSCARAMAGAFATGGRLFTMGNGGSACDAQHVAVEFMHPIFEKRAPLPALALGADAALLSAIGNDRDFSLAFAAQLRVLARAGDMALGLSTSGKSANVTRALRTARELGMLTVAFSGRDGGNLPELCDHLFVVKSFSIHRIQEAHVALLHVLWDAIHVIRGEEDAL